MSTHFQSRERIKIWNRGRGIAEVVRQAALHSDAARQMEPGLPKDKNTYQLEHYLISQFGDIPLRKLETFSIQIWLNGMADKGYSQSVMRQCFTNIRAITYMAKKQKYLAGDPGEDVTMPQTKLVERPLMTRQQILKLIGATEDVHDLCLLYVGIFCGPRASEVLGLQWKSWTGEALMPHGTAYKGRFLQGSAKDQAEQSPYSCPRTGTVGNRSLAKAVQGSIAGCSDVPNVRTWGAQGAGGAAPGKNFLKWRSAPPREHQDDRRRIRADHRAKRVASGEFPHNRGA